MNIRLTHIDGKLPNLALMKLAHWHKAKGDHIFLERTMTPHLWEPVYNTVYGSSIFSWSSGVIARLRETWPNVILGGTGTGDFTTVETLLGLAEYEHYDYSIYPTYAWSLGFTQRGCRLNCGFCVVPKKEGKPKSINTIWDIWRPGTPRYVCLLDNDFFGQPEAMWQARLAEVREGGFRICFNQGVNIRMVTAETAQALASVPYYDDQFQHRRLYTAWDNLGQERIFFRGMELLRDAGIPPKHLMVYMLIGYAPGETFEQIMYRYRQLKEAGCKPFPMVYDNQNRELRRFQRWVIRRYDEVIPWEQFGTMPSEQAESLPLPLGEST